MKFTQGMKKVGGRQKGTPNRLTSSLREAMILAFEEIGGREALAKWAGKNRADFYRLIVRLIPVEKADSEPEGVTVIIASPTGNTPEHFQSQNATTIEASAKEHLQCATPSPSVLGLPEPRDATGNTK